MDGHQRSGLGCVANDCREVEAAPALSTGQRVGKALRWFAALFLFGALLFWLVPDKMLGVANTFRANLYIIVPAFIAALAVGFVWSRRSGSRVTLDRF